MGKDSASPAGRKPFYGFHADKAATQRTQPTLQERIDAQAMEWLERQPRILNGSGDFREIEQLALQKDLKGMKAFISRRARDARDAHLTYWKKFFRLQRQSPGRPPEPEIEKAASMRTHGLTYPEIAQRIVPDEYKRSPEEAANRIRKDVENYCRKARIPVPRRTGKNSSH